MLHQLHVPAEYDSARLVPTLCPGALSYQPCQESPTPLAGFRLSILPALWAASAAQGGWSCKHTPARLEKKTKDGPVVGLIRCLKLDSARLEKVDVETYTSCGLLCVVLLITYYVNYTISSIRFSTYQYILVHTSTLCVCCRHIY
jgi:hypothetical protein